MNTSIDDAWLAARYLATFANQPASCEAPRPIQWQPSHVIQIWQRLQDDRSYRDAFASYLHLLCEELFSESVSLFCEEDHCDDDDQAPNRPCCFLRRLINCAIQEEPFALTDPHWLTVEGVRYLLRQSTMYWEALGFPYGAGHLVSDHGPAIRTWRSEKAETSVIELLVTKPLPLSLRADNLKFRPLSPGVPRDETPVVDQARNKEKVSPGQG